MDQACSPLSHSWIANYYVAVIMPPSMDSIGRDGLFGMNFISRFKVEIEESKITVSAEG